jgi:hypothetical protein
MKTSFLASGAAALLAGTLCAVFAQQLQPSSDAFEVPPDRGAAGMLRMLRSLQTRASLLLFTAHPDDEDGGMLAYESRGLGARTGLMTLNRGEGGQNVMSMDLYDALGLIRTQELLVRTVTWGSTSIFRAWWTTDFRRLAKRLSKSGAMTAFYRTRFACCE